MPFVSFFTKNPLVGWALALIALLGAIRGKEEIDEARGRHQQRTQDEARARRLQTQLRKQNNEKSTQVDDARASAPRGITASESVPEHLAEHIFSD